MELHDGLRNILKEHLIWNKAHLDCFIGMLFSLLHLKQVNLTQLALAFPSDATLKSRYRRRQRFFQKVSFDDDAMAALLMKNFGFYGKNYYLTLDRTNWKWGKKNLNILTLGVVYRGIAIPILWEVLDKQGNSNQGERITLMQQFINQFGQHNISGLLGDREFIGKKWWAWLSNNSIPYLVRVKKNQKIIDAQNQERTVSSLFSDLKVNKIRVLRKPRWMSDQWVWLSGMKLESGELLILAGNQYFKKPMTVYGYRWEIETLFQSLKGRGFHWEETRLTTPDRIKKMMALLAIAFCWSHKMGEWKHKEIKPLQVKKHGRLEQSLFRYGLDYLTDCLIKQVHKAIDVTHLLMIFLCPPDMSYPQKVKKNIKNHSAGAI